MQFLTLLSQVYSLKYDKTVRAVGLQENLKPQLPQRIEEKTQTGNYPSYKIGSVIIDEA